MESQMSQQPVVAPQSLDVTLRELIERAERLTRQSGALWVEIAETSNLHDCQHWFLEQVALRSQRIFHDLRTFEDYLGDYRAGDTLALVLEDEAAAAR